ncbi:pseudouridine synthase [Ureibacillus sp. FSL K6-8385]|uniref:Pseudouridine synthase n=1 Tax=Ureibacillus terrenus TaxID=118246 RepID=A0A540V0E1_9BACL|nr:pseudouridine synthase [Ureibacillus terrenus]MED3662510.1 pseudouridine synthase [Ureibacillus terrenus]MED3764842.1 pseudouridine synthase [Ureibacillus terrenus]TQE90178.1 rRNA pseudouridine synthase [Ureibacillus terrenus]
MRLDKLLANSGYGSRKEVKQLLKKEQVTVDGKVVKDPAMHVDPDRQEIYVFGEKLEYKKYIYIMMNKPKGVISATEDLREKTVIDLLSPLLRHYHPFPVGRLDKNTVGLLLLTNDGDLAHQLLSPKKHVPKTYFARVKGKVTEEDVRAFQQGVVLDDGTITKPAELKILKSGDLSEIELTIYEGKFHQVKRMFEAVNKKVVFLKRLSMGNLTLDPNLKYGDYRELTDEEVKAVQQYVHKKE